MEMFAKAILQTGHYSRVYNKYHIKFPFNRLKI